MSTKKVAIFRKVLYNSRKYENEVTEMVVSDKLNLTMLCDFYELTMGAGYFANGYTDRITYSAAALTGAGSPLRPVWSRSSSIFRSCILTRRTSRTCGNGSALTRIS